VQPVKLVFRDGHYYLWGYSYTRDRYYEFRVDRIERGSLRVLPSRASDPPRRPMLAFQCILSPKLTRGGTIPDFPVIDAMDPQSDGSLLITAQHYADFWIIQEVLRYGGQAEITSPGWLRKKMRETVEAMKGLYDKALG
jgi:predicted DNA-binding transcriptional regulator YafY